MSPRKLGAWRASTPLLLVATLAACESETRRYPGPEYSFDRADARPIRASVDEDERVRVALRVPADDPLLEVVRAGPAKVDAGEEFSYRITVENRSDQLLDEVVIHERYPADQVTFGAPSRETGVAAKGGAGAAEPVGGAPGSWELGTLRPGDRRTIEVNAVARMGGTLESLLTADFRPAAATRTEVAGPELVLERQVVDAAGQPVREVYVDEPVFLLYRVRNVGPLQSGPLTVEERLPGWVTTASGGEPSVQVELERVGPGGVLERRIPLAFDRGGEFRGSAAVRSGPLLARSDEGAVRVLQPELGLELRAPARAYVGQGVATELTVMNRGQDPARDVTLELELPPDASEVRSSLASIREGQEQPRVDVGDLEPGERRTFWITYEADTPTELSTAARVSGRGAEPVERQLITQVLGIPALRLEVLDGDDPVEVGSETTCTIRIENQGSARDIDLLLQVQVPPGFDVIETTGDSALRGGRVLEAELERLEPGQSATWELRLLAREPGQGRLRVAMTSNANHEPVVQEEPINVFDRP